MFFPKKLKSSIYLPNNNFVIFFSQWDPVCLIKVPSDAEQFEGGKLSAPKTHQKMDFFNFWGADNLPLFTNSEGTFIRQTF